MQLNTMGSEAGGESPGFLARSFGSFSSIEDATGSGGVYEVKREDSGEWTSTSVSVPFSMFPFFDIDATSPDLASSLWLARSPGGSERETYYLRGRDGGFTLIGPAQPSTANERITIFAAAASDDLSHVILQAFAPRLWPGDTTEGRSSSLYEYAGTGNELPLLVGVQNGSASLVSNCGTFLGSSDGESYNALSKDGATIFFTASACGGSPPASELFARVDNGQANARTVAISEPLPEDCGTCTTSPPREAQFRGASSDGSRAFFMTEQPLLPGAGGVGSDLYEYAFAEPEHERVKLLSGGAAGSARVQGVARVSEDGSHVYFVAQGVLTAEANAFGAHAKDGAENLYVSIRECADGGADCAEPSRRLAFIGQLAEEDLEDWGTRGGRPVQTTPEGRFLVFESRADLTPDQGGREEAGQVFEYDTQTGGLLRVSRGEAGYGEDGNTKIYRAQISGGLTMSNDGAYVFFTSEDSLTPQAVPGYRSVYEYHNGNVALISGGHDLAVVSLGPGVELYGTDPSGRDVFFATTERLLPQDGDTQQDFYDARIGGGPPAAVVRAPCAGDACQGAPSGVASSLAPGTQLVTPEAAGAVSPAKPKAKPKAAHARKHARKRKHRKRGPRKPAKRRG